MGSVSLRESQKLATTRLISIVAPPTPFIYVAQPYVRLHPGTWPDHDVDRGKQCQLHPNTIMRRP